MEASKIRELYSMSDGSLNEEKLFYDLGFWLDFEEEYNLKELGGISRLRHILGEPSSFIEKYSKERRWW